MTLPLFLSLLCGLVTVLVVIAWCISCDVMRSRDFTTEQHTEVMSKLKDLAGNLATIETTLNKVKTEVEALKTSLEDVDLPAEAEAALERLTSLSAALDALNPDATPPA